MLKSITWMQFLDFIVVGLVIYYVIVGLVFYRKKITKVMFKQGPDTPPSFELSRVNPEAQVAADKPVRNPGDLGAARKASAEEEGLYPLANELVESIDLFMVKAGRQSLGRSEVEGGIRGLIDQYPMLRGEGFRVAINNYISIAIKNNCEFSMDDTEIAGLWSPAE